MSKLFILPRNTYDTKLNPFFASDSNEYHTVRGLQTPPPFKTPVVAGSSFRLHNKYGIAELGYHCRYLPQILLFKNWEG